MRRFTGTVERIAAVDGADIAAWIAAIPFSEWHQQRPLGDGQLRPAMMTDLAWQGFGAIAGPVVDAYLAPHIVAYGLTLSVVMPGHAIEAHRDAMASDWLWRVHVPLLTNDRAVFICGGERHCMEVGSAYRVNAEAEHAIENGGDSPRVHLMFDVRSR